MRTISKLLLFMTAAVGCATLSHAQYVETMHQTELKKNAITDFGLVDDEATNNQSAIIQKAIDDVSAAGGGRLLIPKGTYRFSGISMKSNVHLLVAGGTMIKPWWPEGTKVGVFNLGSASNDPDGHIENVSIRGVNGKFTIDCSEHGAIPGEGIRAVTCKRVKNFLLSDISIIDNFTTYCAFSFTPMKHKDSKGWKVWRPTDGLVKNLDSIDSGPGYGLLQMHAGERIHFENLSAKGGGVTFRLETGAGGLWGGVFDITANNLYCENGSRAAMLGPHTAQNGVVKIDGVLTKSCAVAVSCGSGFIEKKYADNPNYQRGKFAEGTTIENVHAVFGTDAPISVKGLGEYPEAYLADLRIDENDRKQKRVRGPSSGVVRDSSGDSWNPIIQNVTSEGFKYNRGIVRPDGKKKHGAATLKNLPIYEQLQKQKEENEQKFADQTARNKKGKKKKSH